MHADRSHAAPSPISTKNEDFKECLIMTY